MKPNDMKARRMKEAEERNPNTPRDKIINHAQLRSEVHGLRAENSHLHPLKTELARMRANFADVFYGLSEK